MTCSSPGEVYIGKASPAPERTLVQFISTSAAFHGVKKQPLRSLESDLLKVFANNVMPANAAAWYMAKRKFYILGNQVSRNPLTRPSTCPPR